MEEIVDDNVLTLAGLSSDPLKEKHDKIGPSTEIVRGLANIDWSNIALQILTVQKLQLRVLSFEFRLYWCWYDWMVFH